MNVSLLWRAALVQLAAVAALFAVLVVLPLGEDFFRDYGAVAGPLSWALCSAVTGCLLSLAPGTVLQAAVGSGAVAVMVGLLAGHSLALAAGVMAFGALVALRGRVRAPRDGVPDSRQVDAVEARGRA